MTTLVSKIEAIKALRFIFDGLGLVEAKGVVDAYINTFGDAIYPQNVYEIIIFAKQVIDGVVVIKDNSFFYIAMKKIRPNDIDTPQDIFNIGNCQGI